MLKNERARLRESHALPFGVGVLKNNFKEGKIYEPSSDGHQS